MKILRKGEYFGTHNQELRFNNVIITDIEYTQEKVDWHYHENPYFTYLLEGKLFERNKKEEYYLNSGSLVFHNWQDAHYNIKPPVFTRGFHIELNAQWFKDNEINVCDYEGSMKLQNAEVKTLVSKIFFETKVNDRHSQLSIEVLILEIFDKIGGKAIQSNDKPKWVNTIRELITEESNSNFSLSSLSKKLGIHSSHLSRDFSKYFGTTLGNYIRLQKVNKAMLLISKSKFSMTEICYRCGFYDQSHFILNFKRIYNVTPTSFLKIISER